MKSASKRRKLDERSFERVEDDDAYQNTLSQATKETVLKLKKISDPFQAELQSVRSKNAFILGVFKAIF